LREEDNMTIQFTKTLGNRIEKDFGAYARSKVTIACIGGAMQNDGEDEKSVPEWKQKINEANARFLAQEAQTEMTFDEDADDDTTSVELDGDDFVTWDCFDTLPCRA
jgi:hypothetical protein